MSNLTDLGKKKRTIKTIQKKVEEEFGYLQDNLARVRGHTKISEETLLDAYILAKAIQEKNSYKLDASAVLEKLGIEIHIEKCEVEPYELDNRDYSYIDLKEKKITIKYYAVRKPKYISPCKNCLEAPCDLDTCTCYNCQEDGYEYDEKYYWYSISHNNLSFLIVYTMVFILFYPDLNKALKIHYGKDYSMLPNEELPILVTWYLFYIKYDYAYRLKRYRWNLHGGEYLVSEHVKFFSVLDGMSDLQKHVYIKYFPGAQKILSEEILSSAYKEDKITEYTLRKMDESIRFLEKTSSEKYEEASKMKCRKNLYDEHNKLVNLIGFRPIKIE